MGDQERRRHEDAATRAATAASPYEALEADAGDARQIAAEARALEAIDASAVFDDEDDLDAADEIGPVTLRIETWSGEELTEEIEFPAEAEREPASNYDQPRVWPPADREPTTGDYNIEDLDAEGDWPDE